ncbi:interferon-induced protein with tetratricopeptide repeats 5-like [Protopterus annectens]|uniref:interferon-induced protein with tetratricopeptide repeats 5-like n=1 Tax=Protopterus annectens TaxID=7888 RepID=UPI001CFBA4BD|nr:interferon-induced protein with tetratricopeptide repeats 5-like [Protopterus annectens]
MSAELLESLKSKLLQLECHFTWGLKNNFIDIEDYEERMHNEIKFAEMKSVYHCYNRLAYASHLKGNYEEALARLQKAEESIRKDHANDADQHSVVNYGNFAWVYYYRDRKTESENYLQKVQNICKKLGSPSLYTVPLAEVYGEKGWTLLSFCRSYYVEAAECFEKALKENPIDPECNTGYAVALYRLETPVYVKCIPEQSKSLPQLKRSLAVNPNDTLCMVLLGLKLQDFGKQREGLEYIEQALQKSPDVPHVIRYVAKFLRKYGSIDMSLDLLNKALEKTPNSAFLHHQVGICYKQKMFHLRDTATNPRRHSREIGNLIRNGIYHFELAAELKPQFHYALLDLATMYKQAHHFEKVEECFKKLYDIPSHTPENLQEIHVDYALFLLKNKKLESNAVLYFKEGLKIKNPSKSRCLCSSNLLKIAERKLYINPKDSTALGILGFVHLQNEKKSQAIDCYKKALQYDPDNVEYLNALTELQLSL